MDTLGRSAATEALRYVEWCCSVGLVAVYAKVRKELSLRGNAPISLVRSTFFRTKVMEFQERGRFLASRLRGARPE